MKYPYTPEVLDALPESVAEIFREVEDDVLAEICTMLEAAKFLAKISVQELQNMRDVPQDTVEKAIQAATGKGRTKIKSIMSDVVTQNTRFYTDMQKQMGLTAFKPILSGSLADSIQKQTLDTYQNLSGSMGFLVDSGRTMVKPAKAYQWAIDNAILQIQSGAMNYEQAIKVAVRSLAKSGIKTVWYESGKVDQMDVAVRRAVLTGANQLCLKFSENAMGDLYTDLVEVSAHVGARNHGIEPENHEMWQGKVYRWTEKPRFSFGDYPDFILHTGYGSGEGLGGINCRHSFHAFVEGVSERTYTDDELDSMKAENRTFQYEGKEYDGYTATQKQRQIERTLRKLKRERSSYKAAGLKDEYNAVNAKIRRLTYKYRRFSKKAGLPEQRERTKVQYSDTTELNQKNRGKKVTITEQAVEKVGLVKPHGLSDRVAVELQSTHKSLLKYAKDENDSNEVACLFDMRTGKRLDFVRGTTDYVDIERDAESYHWLHNMDEYSIMLCHNHPGLSYFSANDVRIFMHYRSIGSMSVVTNLGKVWTITKTDKFDHTLAQSALIELSRTYGNDMDKIIDKFIRRGYNYGIERS